MLESGRKAVYIGLTVHTVLSKAPKVILTTRWRSRNGIQNKQTFVSRATATQAIYTDSVAMTAALATWADCWAVTGLREDLIGRQALFRAHVTHYTSSLLAGPRNHKVNHIKQILEQRRCRWMIVRSKFTNRCFRWANTSGTTQKISIRHVRFSLILQPVGDYKVIL